MKHIGSQDALHSGLGSGPEAISPRRRLAAAVRRQSLISWVASLACVLLLTAVVADAPVRDLARSLDPSVVAVLRVATEFGNSAWPLGIALLLLAAVTIVARQPDRFSSEATGNLRSALLLVIGSVAISGTLASLTKNMIGRARPSTGDYPHVFEFAFLSFRAGWAAFPSGHATTATACAIALAVAFPRQALAWLSIGLTAALSRAFLGVHWLTDCLAGLALGALVSLWLRNRLERRGHAFQVEPALPFRVLAAGATVCLSQAYVLTRRAVEPAAAYVRQRILSLRSARPP
jgi:membrane-associated phospholipid phosphatase